MRDSPLVPTPLPPGFSNSGASFNVDEMLRDEPYEEPPALPTVPPGFSESGSNYPDTAGLPARISHFEQNLSAQESTNDLADNVQIDEATSSSRSRQRGRRIPPLERFLTADNDVNTMKEWLKSASEEQRAYYEAKMKERDLEIQRKDEEERARKREYNARRYREKKDARSGGATS